MSILDKIEWPREEDRRRRTRRRWLKRQGAGWSARARPKDQLDNAQDKVARKAEEVVNLERKT